MSNYKKLKKLLKQKLKGVQKEFSTLIRTKKKNIIIRSKKKTFLNKFYFNKSIISKLKKQTYSFIDFYDKRNKLIFRIKRLYKSLISSTEFKFINNKIEFSLKKIRLILIERISGVFSNISNEENIAADLTLLPPPPIWSRVFIWTLSSGSISIIIWSVFTTIEETIILTGELTTITPEVKISAMDPGRITEVLVKTNQYVEKFTPLLIYEDDETKARLNGARKRLEYGQNQRINLFDSYDLKLSQLNEEIKFKQNLVEKYKTLEIEGAVSEIQYLQNQIELKELEKNYKANLLEKDNILYQNAEQLEQISTLILELEAKTNRFKIESPVSGYIQNIKYQSPGERIMANDVVITVVPDNEIIVKASIPSKVSAPIQAGMEAVVEVDAFPSDDFGGIIAEVFTISPTVSTDTSSGVNRRTYIAEIKLISPEIQGKISFDELRSGMAITTKIKLRDKPIIASIFNIISDIFDPLAQQR